ncbi:MAG: TonB-dependent receptor, partial [Rhodothermales bacterium]|nr:TonB-dependent receptor [Rhodothermales bacterium]
HQGIEVGVAASPVGSVDVSLAYSYAVHRYEDWETQIDEDFSGNEMEVAPRSILNASVTYRIPVLHGASLALEWNRLGSYWMDPENTSKYGGHDVLNLLARIKVADNVSLRARVGNLTDELYAERATHNQFRGDEFAPGLPRTVNVALQYGL